MAGYRVLTSVRLNPDDRDRLLRGVFNVGERSVLFKFADLGDGEFAGAVIEAIELEAEASDRFRVRLGFWNDAAAIQATAGAKFDVWYGRVVGDGRVLNELTDGDLTD